MAARSTLVHVPGQLGLDAATGGLVRGGFTAQMERALDNIEAILAAEGASLANVVRAQIELVDEGDFDAMNRVYADRFREPRPARSSFGVPFIARGAVVQVDVLAALPAADAEQSSVISRQGPEPTAAYPHAHAHGRTVWVTAQAGRKPTSGEMVPGGPAAQMDQAISNLDAILHDCGSALERVIHSQVMAVLDTDVDVLAQVFERRFASRLPAASWVGVSFLAEEPGIDAIRVQLDCVAALD